VRSGKVRYIGCSNFKVWRTARAREISRARGWAEYKAVQMFNTYFQTEKEWRPGCPTRWATRYSTTSAREIG
jgi:aryl-alcohol dehydrogenase-like predicted oxidoreductase